MFFGALILTRPEYQAITAVFALFAAWRVWKDRGWRLAVGSTAVLLVGAALIVLPWTVRNVIVLDELVPVTTGGQKALFVATYLPGDGRQVPTKRELMRRLLGEQDPITTDELKAQPMNELLDRVAQKYPDMPRDQALGRIGRENARKYLVRAAAGLRVDERAQVLEHVGTRLEPVHARHRLERVPQAPAAAGDRRLRPARPRRPHALRRAPARRADRARSPCSARSCSRSRAARSR